MEFGDLGTRHWPAINCASSTLSQFVVIGIASGVEQGAEIVVGLTFDQPRLYQLRLSPAGGNFR